MKTVRPSLVTIAAVWFTVAWAGKIGWSSPEFWLGTSFVWLSWFVILNDVFTVRLRFPAAYYRLRQFEHDGRLYRKLGVRAFRRFVINGDHMNRMKRVHQPSFRFIRTSVDAENWSRYSRAAETYHALHLLLLSPAVAFAASSHRNISVGGLLILLCVFDVYPIFLQRYNRSRIERLLRRPPRK
jgi:hypothetical protein